MFCLICCGLDSGLVVGSWLLGYFGWRALFCGVWLRWVLVFLFEFDVVC